MTLFTQVADQRERAATHNDTSLLMDALLEQRFFGLNVLTATAISTPTALLRMTVTKALTATATPTPALARTVGTTRTAATTPTPSMARAIGARRGPAAATPTPGLTRGVNMTRTAATTPTPTLGRSIGTHPGPASAIPSPLLTRSVGVTRTASSTPTAALARNIGAHLIVAATPAATLTRNMTLAAMTAATNAAAQLAKRVNTRALTAATTATAALRRALGWHGAAPVTPTPSLSTVVTPVGPATIIIVTAGTPTQRWTVGQALPARWHTGRPTMRWRVGMALLGAYSVASKVYCQVPVTVKKAGAAYDPTGDTVQMAFLAGFGTPTSGDWNAAVWDAGGNGIYLASCLIGPSGTVQLAIGTWNVHVKITDSPEIPVIPAGQIEITP